MQNTNSEKGWSQYQQLVLSELQRFDKKQDAIQNQMNNMEIALARLESEVKQVGRDLASNDIDLKAHIKSVSDRFDHYDDAYTVQKDEVNSIKWKIGTFSAILSAIAAWASQYFPNIFTK